MSLRVHAIVFCWPGKVPDALRICTSLTDQVDQITVIDASQDPVESSEDWEWIKVEPTCYFGHKFAHATQHFAGDVLLQIQADASNPDWGAVVNQCRRRFGDIRQLGIWSPEVDFTVWATDRVKLYQYSDAQLAGVLQTDCIVWAMRSGVVDYLRRLDYSGNNFGWGIDWAAIGHCYAHGALVLRDSSAKVLHPKGTGYDKAEAMRQMAWFFRQLGYAEKIQCKLLSKYMGHRLPI